MMMMMLTMVIKMIRIEITMKTNGTYDDDSINKDNHDKEVLIIITK